jgi:glycosyltransferase involved in cell wall biosynthesis
MNLLIVAERFFPEEFIINDLARQMSSDGYRITILTQAPSYPSGRISSGYRNCLFRKDRWGSIRVLRFFTVQGYRRSLLLKLLNYGSFALAGSIIATMIGRRYTRIFIFQTGPLTMAIPGLVAASRCRTRAIIWTQDIWPDSVYAYGFKQTPLLDSWLRAFVRRVYSRCGKVLVSCEGFREKLKPFCGDQIISFVPNWPVMSFAGGKRTRTPGQGMAFAFTGNIGKVQNLENVILGYSEASVVRPAFGSLMIVGDGSALNRLKEVVREKRIEGVQFTGRLPTSHMPDILASSDVAIISLNDDPVFALTVPAKFQAYLSAGKPILCAMKGEVARIVRENGLGIVADPGDVHSIRDAFLEFSRIGEGGLAKYTRGMSRLLSEKYDRMRTIGSIEQILDS